jgi:hypothetical protein
MMKKLRIIFLVIALSFFLSNGVTHAQPTEYQVKAAFLYNFARFTTWPSQDAQPFFNICVLGSDPFGEALDALEGKTIGDNPIKVSRRREISEADCQVLFISRSEQGNLSTILEALAGSPVLTVSEIEGFTEHGGAIQFYAEKNKVRFKINQRAAEELGLKISSHLLKLGK